MIPALAGVNRLEESGCGAGGAHIPWGDVAAETRAREGSGKERSSLTWSARWESGGSQVHDGVREAGRLRLLTSGAHLVPGISCLFCLVFL